MHCGRNRSVPHCAARVKVRCRKWKCSFLRHAFAWVAGLFLSRLFFYLSLSLFHTMCPAVWTRTIYPARRGRYIQRDEVIRVAVRNVRLHTIPNARSHAPARCLRCFGPLPELKEYVITDEPAASERLPDKKEVFPFRFFLVSCFISVIVYPHDQVG